MREYLKTVKGFHIYFEALDEDIPAEEVFGFKQTGVDYSKLIKKINLGEENYFCAKISAVDPDSNEEVGTSYLGCCVYTPARSFIKESGYVDQMIDDAVSEAIKETSTLPSNEENTNGNAFCFRAFDAPNGVMRYSNINDGEFYINTKGVLYMYTIPGTTTVYKTYNVMDFSGRRDRDGVMIFADDVVTMYIESDNLDISDWTVITGRVRVVDGEWCVGSRQYPLHSVFPVKVLGNIYQPNFSEFKAL